MTIVPNWFIKQYNRFYDWIEGIDRDNRLTLKSAGHLAKIEIIDKGIERGANLRKKVFK